MRTRFGSLRTFATISPIVLPGIPSMDNRIEPPELRGPGPGPRARGRGPGPGPGASGPGAPGFFCFPPGKRENE